MRFNDTVHGTVEVDEPVLLELVDSGPVQRLKGVSQAGPPKLIKDKPVTRFDHSLGVMLLLRKHGAPVEEQIAGLLHDVPHTAFSHVADFLFGDEDHEYHERFMEEVVRGSDAEEILEEHGFDLDYILDEENFPLLERDLPDLCADRIDYFLRDWHAGTGEVLEHLMEVIEVSGDRFVLDDREVAEEYALKYIEADERWWAAPEEVAAFELFADALREALESGEISEQDLFGTDDEVMAQLRESDNPRVRNVLETLQQGFDVRIDPASPDLVGESKVRYVDPPVLDGGETLRVTDYSERLRKRIEEHRERMEGGIPMSIV